jgi:hypothetical protein
MPAQAGIHDFLPTFQSFVSPSRLIGTCRTENPGKAGGLPPSFLVAPELSNAKPPTPLRQPFKGFAQARKDGHGATPAAGGFALIVVVHAVFARSGKPTLRMQQL